jgi:DNA-binding beta-propeller fold protein YncE
MQIGHASEKKSNQDKSQFWRPADVFVYPKTNELFVADGYGNRRVIVFDADTGAYKRMWGAFGSAPEDPAPKPRAESAEQSASTPPEVSRIPAKDLSEKDPGPSQFNTVHGIKVSNDGLVYVADRGGKRVQVFTTDGKYINQVWVDRFCESPGGTNLMCGNGQTAASVALSSDPEQRFLYVASRSPSRIIIYERKTLTYRTEFGSLGVKPGQFYGLHHMTTDEKGNLYTSEVEDGRRIQKFVYEGMTAIPDAP